MKTTSVLLFFLLPLLMFSQDLSDRWRGHYSYLKIIDLDFHDETLYAASENAFFIYNLTTGDLVKKSTVNGLSGENISKIYYSRTFDKVILGYETGLIEIYDIFNEDITKVVDIAQKLTLSPESKSINDIMEYEGFLYISTNFGISVYNLERLEFDDSYFIGPGGVNTQVRETEIIDGFIYAATSTGIIRATVSNQNLVDFTVWEEIAEGSWHELDVLNNTLFALKEDGVFNEFDGTQFNEVITFSEPVLDIKTSQNLLTVTRVSEVEVFNEGMISIGEFYNFSNFPELSFSTALSISGNVYIGSVTNGVLISNVQSNTTFESVHPAGPLLNRSFALGGIEEDLWVVHGDYTELYNPFPLDSLGISHYVDLDWKNLTYDNIFEANSLVYITPNPKNIKQVFVGSFFSGLLEINDGVVTNLYNQNNSSLESLDVGDPTYVDIRISGATFDNQDNLWVLNSRVNEGLKQRKFSGEWESHDLSLVAPVEQDNLGLKEMVIDINDYKLISSERHGIIGYTENNGNPLVKSVSGPEANFASSDVRALAIDSNNRLWIGTTRGLRVMFNTADFFSNDNKRVEPVIILDDGIPSELLFDQFINDIKVDGSDNKWIATADSGAYYMSPDGNETIYHFTSQNSPLPSNAISDILIDGTSGRVFFATPKGLVSFQGKAVLPSSDLNNIKVFPNPVRPEYTGNITITGLIAKAVIKITDVTGNLVYETTAQGGSIQWDLTVFGKHKVATGVYIVLISDEEGIETAVTKIMVIR